ncbi:hypothetical protein F4778DRAFT_257020 [Xylariomycetidae sp. FL2044]|nr:hypothetical protein F4778DRAFT_257020 [Xylariomycetidae sp. FL2044]
MDASHLSWPQDPERSGSLPSSSGATTKSSASNSTAPLSGRSLLSRHFTLPSRQHSIASHDSTRTTDYPKGPLGLITLFSPVEGDTLLAHIVFVHGLGGGSEHTWCQEEVLWPRDLLPKQNPFEKTTIHVFGYDSDFKKSSTLNIHDFSKSLLNSMLNSPEILKSQSPVILVGHSMGGLVIKKAYMFAKQTAIYEDLARRIKAIIFIATPHTGSELAPTLERIFRLSSGLKPYLTDLKRNSDLVQTINAQFPTQSLDLMLTSFYETQPLSMAGVRDVMIVPKMDAVLNYPHEQSALLYGDHRSICKFSSSDDHNYIAVWQSIAACIARSSEHNVLALGSPSINMDKLNDYLGVSEPPADDLYRVRADRLPGTCSWLSDHATFDSWLQGSMPKLLWVRGPPGSGKSCVAGHVVDNLDDSSRHYCYYFFNHDDRVKSSAEGFLLSIAWQMAAIYPDVRNRLLQICRKDPDVAKAGDFRTLYRKLWEQGILKANLEHPVYWVIDAFDECRSASELGRLLLRVHEKVRGSVRIFATSRNAHSDYHISLEHAITRNIDIDETQADIALYLEANSHEIPGSNHLERNALRDLILEKSNGCFLWAALVLKRLSKIIGAHARFRALEEMPPGIDQLYSRIVTSMSTEERNILRTILTWVACAARPLTTSELKYVLETVSRDQIDDIKTIVSKYCHDLVYIDKSLRVKMRHASARHFLLRQDINSTLPPNFTIQEEAAHKEILMACLNFLNGPDMKAKGRRKMVMVPRDLPAFVGYACQSVSEHVNRSSALDQNILESLATFLKANVLAWVEYLASQADLETILQFAQVLRTFLRRKSRVNLLLGEEVVIIDAWATDLVKLVSKFGRQLLVHPESIFQLIPPFYPTDSAPFQQFGRGPGTTISVIGLSKNSWDDCLCTLVPSKPLNLSSGQLIRERLLSLSSSDEYICIGTSQGRISIFNERTYMEERVIDHGSAITHLVFGGSRPILASASKRVLRIWNSESWEQQWQITPPSVCLAMTFIEDDTILLIALKSNSLLALNLVDRTETLTRWTDFLDESHRQVYHGTAPQFASFNPDIGLLALGYSHRHVLVYNYEMESYQIFHHRDGLVEYLDDQSNASLYSMTFSKMPDTSLLAVSYSTADLVLFDTELGTVQAVVSSACFPRLVSSGDGRTLAAARMNGAIELYDFENLHRLYRIRPDEGAVAALSFTTDSTRFLVIRAGGHSCRIWDPITLYRRDVGHSSVRSPSLGSGSQDGVCETPEESIAGVCAVACDTSGEAFFVGKDDHHVYVYDARSGTSVGVLATHVAPIKALHFASKGSKNLLISVDSAGFLSVHAVHKFRGEWSTKLQFTHRASVTGVQQFLCDSLAERLLVCSNDKATLISLYSGSVLVPPSDCSEGSEEAYVWANHPLDDSLLLCITTSNVRIYSWASAEQLIETRRIALHTDLPAEFQVAHALTIGSGKNACLAMKYAVPNQRGTTALVFIDGTSILPPSINTQPMQDCQPLCDVIDLIIGMFKDRLVFLHIDGWVCSVKTNGPSIDVVDVCHHFAPPQDWLRTQRERIIKISKLGDILFVVGGDVVLVKRGLGKTAIVR